MKWLAQLIPVLVLLAVAKQACRRAAQHRHHEAELDGATL